MYIVYVNESMNPCNQCASSARLSEQKLHRSSVLELSLSRLQPVVSLDKIPHSLLIARISIQSKQYVIFKMYDYSLMITFTLPKISLIQGKPHVMFVKQEEIFLKMLKKSFDSELRICHFFTLSFFSFQFFCLKFNTKLWPA